MRQTEVTKNVIAPSRQARKERALSFRPKGEIFLRSLAFARDDRPRPITLAPLRLGARHSFSNLFSIGKFQISLARFSIWRISVSFVSSSYYSKIGSALG